MKRRLKTRRLRMLLPVIAMTLFVVILLTVLFSYAYVRMILRQEQDEAVYQPTSAEAIAAAFRRAGDGER